MQSKFKPTFVAAATILLGTLIAGPASAQEGRFYRPVVPSYQGPDGSYDSVAAFSRDYEGVPCGMNCTRRALERWSGYGGRYYHD
jgi:hypothetical protein